MEFHVYCWLCASSVEAEVCERVQAVDAVLALQQVMRAHSLAYVAYAWVVPEDEAMACYDAVEVFVTGKPCGECAG